MGLPGNREIRVNTVILTAKSSQVYFEKVDASWVTTITLFSLFLELRIVYPSFNWNERYCFNTMILFNVEFSFCNGQHLFDINKKDAKIMFVMAVYHVGIYSVNFEASFWKWKITRSFIKRIFWFLWFPFVKPLLLFIVYNAQWFLFFFFLKGKKEK